MNNEKQRNRVVELNIRELTQTNAKKHKNPYPLFGSREKHSKQEKKNCFFIQSLTNFGAKNE